MKFNNSVVVIIIYYSYTRPLVMMIITNDSSRNNTLIMHYSIVLKPFTKYLVCKIEKNPLNRSDRPSLRWVENDIPGNDMRLLAIVSDGVPHHTPS